MSGALFQPFRALGLIADDVPFAVQRRGTATFVTVSTGKAWQVRERPSAYACVPAALAACQTRLTPAPRTPRPQIYNCDKLRLLLVGPQVRPHQPSCRRHRSPLSAAAAACSDPCKHACMHACTHAAPLLPPLPARQLKHTITALAAKGDLTFAALRGGAISECRRVHAAGVYRGHTADVLQLLVLGDRLLSLGADSRLLVWRIGEYAAPEAAIQLPRCGRRRLRELGWCGVLPGRTGLAGRAGRDRC